jgi:hypothetical protein
MLPDGQAGVKRKVLMPVFSKTALAISRQLRDLHGDRMGS